MPIDPKTQNEDGTWRKGVSGNPGGKHSRANFTKLLGELFTDELVAYMLFCKTHGINTNIDTNSGIVKLIEHPDVKKKFRKYLRKIKPNGKYDARTGHNVLSNKDQFEILKWLTEFKYGRAVQQINSEISTPENRKIQIEFIKPDSNES